MKFAIVFALLAVASGGANGAEPASKLKDTVLAQDQAVFDAFNRCDAAEFRKYFDPGVEFYQDNDDVSVGVDELVKSFDGRCVGGKSNLRRELDAAAAEVHPIQGFGAVQLGSHAFWIVADGKPRELAARPRFVHLWKRQGERWVITRVISYGH
ncbi:nuclear transport factor 2 family protein [Pseudomonas sp. CGJS7]|uniref:nuclear transport factor 2 family protein n=1 Tax=Pseudomonas sp. CGJS7 TaxID=3109348 RepID=UPI00300A39AA